MSLRILHLIFFYQTLLAASPLTKVSDRLGALPFVEISDEDENRLNNPDNSAFAPHIPIILKERKSVRARMTAVRDQGKRGTCNTFAAVGLIEFFERGDFSEQCLSYFSSDEDTGSPNERVEWAIKNGLYKETDCPYDGRNSGRNNIPNLSSAKKVHISQEFYYYPQHRVNALDVIRGQIEFDKPVVVDIYTAGRAWDDTGIINLPTPDEISVACVVDAKSSGNKKCKKHSVIITGFDDNEEYLEFKNSWGMDWPHSGPLKSEGYGKMSYSYFERMKVERAQMVSK